MNAERNSMTQDDPLYTVTQLGAELGITVRTLHFYEAQGLITPRRAGNTRVYSQRDRGRMILILRGKRLGFSIREIKEYLELYDMDPTHEQQTKALLKSVRERIKALSEQQTALTQTLSELHDIEQQALAALQEMKAVASAKTPSTPLPTGRSL
jgi:DNA-binding transcriptional MerR regulator